MFQRTLVSNQTKCMLCLATRSHVSPNTVSQGNSTVMYFHETHLRRLDETHLRRLLPVLCATIHLKAVRFRLYSYKVYRGFTATHCNTLQHTAAHCNTPYTMPQYRQSVSCGYCNTLQHTATHHTQSISADKVYCVFTATHCNTLQHTTHNAPVQTKCTVCFATRSPLQHSCFATCSHFGHETHLS